MHHTVALTNLAICADSLASVRSGRPQGRGRRTCFFLAKLKVEFWLFRTSLGELIEAIVSDVLLKSQAAVVCAWLQLLCRSSRFSLANVASVLEICGM